MLANRTAFSDMPPDSSSASCDASIEERAPDLAAGNQCPILHFDAQAGTLLDANPMGWALWGRDAANPRPPIALDAAMPAMRRLQALAKARDCNAGARQQLTFWTARGLVTLDCRVTLDATRSGLVVVQAMHGGADAAGAGAAAKSSCQGAAGDVGFDARLAHELRTPLSAVIAYAEILKNEHFGPLANPRYKEYACDIFESARHALGVIDSMLQGERARSDLPALAFVDLDPADVVDRCMTVARPLAARAGLALDAELPERLPRVIADELSLRQMLLNLLSNAIKFAHTGDKVAIAVDYDCGGPLRISVSDTGPGMCEAPKREAAGLGLGLPLTRALAAANGASVAIESAPGRGTRVTIAFAKDRVVPV